MLKILALEKEIPGTTAEQFTDDLMRAEALRAWELHQSGIFREMYFQSDQDVAVLMLECESVVDARAMLETLPLVQHRLIDFDLIPLKAYPGFARLFHPPI